MKPFNTTRAVFYLVAAVIGFQCLVVFTGVLLCGLNLDIFIREKLTCDRDSKLFELLTGALTAALAFAGGMMSKDHPPPGPPPP